MRVFKRRRLVKRGLTTAVKRVSGERHPVLDFFERGVVPRTVTALLLLAAITFIVAKPGGYVRQLSLGETAKQTIIATTAFKYEDDAKRQLMMDKARATVPAISRLDEAKIAGGFEAYDKFFGEAAEVNEAAEGAEGKVPPPSAPGAGGGTFPSARLGSAERIDLGSGLRGSAQEAPAGLARACRRADLPRGGLPASGARVRLHQCRGVRATA